MIGDLAGRLRHNPGAVSSGWRCALGIRSTIVASSARRHRLTTATISPPALVSETRTRLDERWRQTGRGVVFDRVEDLVGE